MRGEYSISQGGFASYGMECSVTGQTDHDVLKTHSGFICVTEQPKKSHYSWTVQDKSPLSQHGLAEVREYSHWAKEIPPCTCNAS